MLFCVHGMSLQASDPKFVINCKGGSGNHSILQRSTTPLLSCCRKLQFISVSFFTHVKVSWHIFLFLLLEGIRQVHAVIFSEQQIWNFRWSLGMSRGNPTSSKRFWDGFKTGLEKFCVATAIKGLPCGPLVARKMLRPLQQNIFFVSCMIWPVFHGF